MNCSLMLGNEENEIQHVIVIVLLFSCILFVYLNVLEIYYSSTEAYVYKQIYYFYILHTFLVVALIIELVS